MEARLEDVATARIAAEPEQQARSRRQMLWWRLASIALFCAAWEVAGWVPINLAFPTFSATIAAFFEMVADGSMLKAYLLTLQPLIIGLILSAVVGVSVGVAMGLRQSVQWMAAPIFIVLQAAPVAAVIPMVTFVYGIGLTAKVISVCLLALPVIVLNSYKAVANVNPSLINMCRSFLGSRWQQIVKIILPDASPVIFAGLRLGISAGFIGIILAELLITPTGIGDLITYHRAIANYAHMYATIASVIVFSAVTLSVLQWVEERWFRPEKKRS
jgi:ABC-type nitrate/sulfonate/bicarbonate transport system permease component